MGTSPPAWEAYQTGKLGSAPGDPSNVRGLGPMVPDTAVESKADSKIATPTTPILTDDDKRAATTLFDIIGNQAPVDASQYIGSGFNVLEDKDRLKGVPFWVTDITFNESDTGEFASLEVVVGPDRSGAGSIVAKLIINDGGTGIRDQVKQLMENTHGNLGPFFVGKGLRRSDYGKGDVTTGFRLDSDGKPLPAGTTYYLDIPGQVAPLQPAIPA